MKALAQVIFPIILTMSITSCVQPVTDYFREPEVIRLKITPSTSNATVVTAQALITQAEPGLKDVVIDFISGSEVLGTTSIYTPTTYTNDTPWHRAYSKELSLKTSTTYSIVARATWTSPKDNQKKTLVSSEIVYKTP